MPKLSHVIAATWIALGLLTAGSSILDFENWPRNVICGAGFVLIGAGISRLQREKWPPGPAASWLVAGLQTLALISGAGLLSAASFRVFGEGWAVFG